MRRYPILMTAPHRGLPPPAGMALPSTSQGLGPLPQPWPHSEESLRTWLQVKMEEERRKAEHERTQQETQRAETRRVELEMLRESFKYGVPPTLVPMLFMGTGPAKSPGGEWVHEYIAQQMAAFQQQQHQNQSQTHLSIQGAAPSPVPALPLRREPRSILHQPVVPNPPSSAQPPPPPHPTQQQMGPPSGSQAGLPPQYVSTYQLPASTGLPRPGSQGQQPMQPAPPRSGLPRINTTSELQIQQIHPNVPVQMPMGPPPQGAPPAPESAPVSQSPSIFFHHWVPPSQSTGGGASSGAASSPQRTLDSPFSQHPVTNSLTGPEYGNSPKKRKMTISGPSSQPQPLTSSQPFSPTSSSPATSTPSTSKTRSRGHSRNRSDSNSGVRGFEPYSRPITRQRRSLGAGDAPGIGDAAGRGQGQQQQQQYQGDGRRSGSGTPSRGIGQERQEQQQHQQHHQRHESAPPLPPPPSRPYSAGSEFRRQPYPPPTAEGAERDMDREREREREGDRDRERSGA